jgi:hypothetical protein
MTFGEALEADLLAGKLANVAELLASGYTPTPDDCAALATLALNPSTKLRRNDNARRALALAFYQALRRCGVSKDDALERSYSAVPGVHWRIIALLVNKQNNAEAVKIARTIKFEIGTDGMPLFP